MPLQVSLRLTWRNLVTDLFLCRLWLGSRRLLSLLLYLIHCRRRGLRNLMLLWHLLDILLWRLLLRLWSTLSSRLSRSLSRHWPWLSLWLGLRLSYLLLLTSKLSWLLSSKLLRIRIKTLVKLLRLRVLRLALGEILGWILSSRWLCSHTSRVWLRRKTLRDLV